MKIHESENEQEATHIDAELLERLNWREDKTLSFKVHEPTDTEPRSKVDEVQIYTKANGKTMLVPAGENRQPIEVGKVLGTTITVGGVEKDVWNADTKQDALSQEQLANIADVPNKQNNLTPQQLQSIADVPSKQNALSAQQLQNITDVQNKISISNIIDNLTSTDTQKPLSAAQGKALKTLIDALTNKALTVTDIPSLDASKITSGAFPRERVNLRKWKCIWTGDAPSGAQTLWQSFLYYDANNTLEENKTVELMVCARGGYDRSFATVIAPVWAMGYDGIGYQALVPNSANTVTLPSWKITTSTLRVCTGDGTSNSYTATCRFTSNTTFQGEASNSGYFAIFIR